MAKYELYSNLTIEVRTIIEANSEIEALELSQKKEVSICWHGTSECDAKDNWVLTNDSQKIDPYINDIL